MKKVALVLMVFCLGLCGVADAYMRGFEAEPGLGIAGADWMTGPLQVSSDGGASLGRYIGVPEGAGNSNSNPPSSDNGWAVYSFTAPAGDYKIMMRAREVGADSFWFRIVDSNGDRVGMTSDGSPVSHGSGWARSNGINGSSWHWEHVFSDDDNDDVAVIFTLPSAGDYQVQVARREDGTDLDGFIITDDLTLDGSTLPNVIPTPLAGEPATNLVLYEAWDFQVPDNSLPASPDLEADLPGLPATPSETGTVGSFSIAPKAGEENYVMRFKGIIKVDEAGLLGLETRSDDATFLFVGNWWEEGAELVQVVDNNGGHGMRSRHGVIDVEAGYVGIVVTFCQGVGGDGLEVYCWKTGVPRTLLGNSDLVSLRDAWSPSPASGATGVSVDTLLSWQSPFENPETTYDVYVGEPGALAPVATGTSDTSFDPDLAGMTAYHWRVDAYEPNELTGEIDPRKGPVWAFMTETEGVVTITSQPSLVSVEAGGDAMFSVEAESNRDISYQWQLEGEDIAGATDSVLSLPGVSEDDEGNYSCVVSTGYDSVESSGALLSIKDADALVAYWPLDGNGLDMSGNGYHLVAQGDTAFDVGMSSQAAVFDGAGDDLVQSDPNFPVGEALNGQPGITVACWIKSDIFDTDKGFIIFEDPAGNDDYDLRYDHDGGEGDNAVLKMGVTTTAGVRQLETHHESQTTEWQHVVMTWENGGRIRAYLNGIEDAYSEQSGVTNAVLTGFGDIIIGRGGKDQNADTGGWDGMVDEVYVYNYALTAGEVLQFYWAEAGVAGEEKCVGVGGSAGPMDFNNDCVVDILDLMVIVDAYLNSNMTE